MDAITARDRARSIRDLLTKSEVEEYIDSGDVVVMLKEIYEELTGVWFDDPKIYINEYELGRTYGGPEEGGWYYPYGIFRKTIATFNVQDYADAEEMYFKLVEDNEDNTDYLGEGTDFRIEYNEGQDFPSRVPTYE